MEEDDNLENEGGEEDELPMNPVLATILSSDETDHLERR